MSAIFLSHSSGDNAASAEVKDWLAEQGHRSVFLDFDPEAGIPAGRSWEQELYQQLRACRAVIVLCSEESMASRWCFAEITHAKSLGKHVFPLLIAPCEVDPVLMERQIIDLTRDREQGFERLARGLEAAGISAADLYDWDGARPPYPGLLAFQEEDAPIFFGRDREIVAGLDVLSRVRRFGGAGLVMVLGASGSGKSSLVRAGMVPRLRHDLSRWLVVDPFRPMDVPMMQLAGVLAKAFERRGEPRDWLQILERLTGTPERAAPPAAGAALVALVHELRLGSEHSEANVLLVVDQFEELLGHPPEHETSRFLELLRSALDQPGSPLVVVGTMRSDHLGILQQSPALSGFEPETVSLGRMSIESLTQVIEEPARLAGVALESGLVQAMLGDIETDDALPLLAFTLRELYEAYGADRILKVDEYRRRLGGLQGSVARSAESAMASALDTSKRGQARDEADLRDAFLAMVKVDADGRYVRQRVRRDQLTGSAQHLLRPFVEARLLVSGSDDDGIFFEVAHEALFRAWDKLKQWLDDNREILRLRRDVGREARQWETADHGRNDYLLRRGRLQRAVELRDEGLLHLSDRELVFVKESEDAALRFARRKTLRARIALAAALLVAGVMTVQMLREKEARENAVFAQLVMASDAERAERPMLASMLAREAVQLREDDPKGRRALLDSLEKTRRRTELEGHEEPIIHGAFSPDGGRILTVSQDNTARIWDLEGRPAQTLEGHEGWINRGLWSPDGELILTVSDDATGRVWDREGFLVAYLEGHDDGVASGAWSPDGRRILTVSYDATARIWNLEGSLLATLSGHQEVVNAGAFSPPGGERILTVSDDGRARIWDREGKLLEVVEVGGGGVLHGAFSPPAGERILTVSADGSARLWDRSGRPIGAVLEIGGYPVPVDPGSWSPGGERILTVSDSSVRVWDRDGELLATLDHPATVNHGAWSPDGLRILTVSLDANARAWDRGGQLIQTLEGHADSVHFGAWSPDGERILSLAGEEPARVWELRGNPLAALVGHGGRWVNHGAWSPDGLRILTVSQDKTACIWNVERKSCRRLEHSGSVNHGAWSPPDGALVLTVSTDELAHIWRGDGEQIAILEGHSASLNHGAWSPNGKRVLTVADDMAGRVWDRSGHPIAILEGHSEAVRHGAWSPDGQRVLTVSADKTARIWELGAGDPSSTVERLQPSVMLEGHGLAVRYGAWKPDGARVLTVADDRTARIWSSEGDLLSTLEGHTAPIHRGVWSSPFGARILTVSDDATARIWNQDGGLIAVLRGHDQPVRHGAWSPNGQRILTVSNDLTARIWQLDGQLAATLRGHTEWINHGAWSRPYGDRILTVSNDGTARIWPAGSLEDLAAQLITRSFTEEERAEYLELE